MPRLPSWQARDGNALPKLPMNPQGIANAERCRVASPSSTLLNALSKLGAAAISREGWQRLAELDGIANVLPNVQQLGEEPEI